MLGAVSDGRMGWTLDDSHRTASDIVTEMSAKYRDFLRAYSDRVEAIAPGYSRAADARFLVISDLHGANRLSLARAVIGSEAAAGRRLDAVLVLGDLVNFGFPIELRIGRFRRSLALLKIPVLVILGNHDKHAPADTSVARYLARVPNVQLMQTGGAYHVRTFGRVGVGGFDDPRYYGDDNVGNARKQHPAREAFLRAAHAQGGIPDIVMVHEPYAAGGPPSLWLNGHMHTPRLDLQCGRIQVGMFTDGMPYYNRRAHRRAPSNFVLLAARKHPASPSVASVTFRWARGTPQLLDVEAAG